MFTGPGLSQACGFPRLQRAPRAASAFWFQSRKHPKPNTTLTVDAAHCNLKNLVQLWDIYVRYQVGFLTPVFLISLVIF